MDKALVIYSGGMDSFTLIHDVIRTHPKAQVRALSFDYGQRHSVELQYAMRVCDDLAPAVTHIIMELKGLGAMLSGSALTSADVEVPEGHYAADNMKLTVVPGRNTIMLSIAMGLAEAWAAPGENVTVFYGAHAGDHTIYPDCRLDYVLDMQEVFKSATEGRVALQAPFIRHTKGDILRVGRHMRLDYSKTWSCYKGALFHVANAELATERTEAFNENDMIDPWWASMAMRDTALVYQPEEASPAEQAMAIEEVGEKLNAEAKPKKAAIKRERPKKTAA